MPAFEQMWNACSQEEARISLVNNKEEDEEEENTLNPYFAHHKKKGTFKKFKGPKKKVDLSKIECYNRHKMGRYKNQHLENPKNKKRDRDQTNITEEAPPKKIKIEELEVKYLYY